MDLNDTIIAQIGLTKDTNYEDLKAMYQVLSYKLTRINNELDDVTAIAHLLEQNPISQSHLHRRTKRGLINLLGEVSKTLFGTAVDSDVQTLARKLNIVGQAVKNQGKVVTAVYQTVQKI